VLLAAKDGASNQRNTTVVFFPGDLQDCTAKQMRSAGNGAFVGYNLQATAQALLDKHKASRCLCVRANSLRKGVYAHYKHFCPTLADDNSIPSYDGKNGQATEHLAALLDSAIGPAWEDGTLELVAFSHGLVVMNQLLAELAQTPVNLDIQDVAVDLDIQDERLRAKTRAVCRVWTCVRALHDVDGANNGPHYPPPQDGVQAVMRWRSIAQQIGADKAELSWFVHGTRYLMKESPDKTPEQSAFIDAVRKVDHDILHEKILRRRISGRPFPMLGPVLCPS
jgi:hypothetical protein